MSRALYVSVALLVFSWSGCRKDENNPAPKVKTPTSNAGSGGAQAPKAKGTVADGAPAASGSLNKGDDEAAPDPASPTVRATQSESGKKRGGQEAGDNGHGRSQPEKSKSGKDASKERQRGSEETRTKSTEPAELRGLGYLDFSEDEVDEEEGGGVVLFDEPRSHPGYSLYCSIPDSLAELIDARGRVIRSWHYESSQQWARCELLPNGDLLVLGRGDLERKSRQPYTENHVLRMSWDGALIWKRDIPAHHDLELTPHGRIAVLTAARRRVPEIDPEKDIQDNLIALLSEDGEVIEQRSLYDALTAAPDIFTLRPGRWESDRKGIDLIHANSLEWMPHEELAARNPLYASSSVIVACRHQDSVAIINWDEKKLLWAWGRGELSTPHEATFLKNGNVLVFDNGSARSWSRVVEVNPLTDKIEWEYKAPNPRDFFSRTRGVAQRLANGNTLITNTNSGEAFEVVPEGEIVWRFLNPHLSDGTHRGTIRMTRYEPAYVDRIVEKSSKP